MTAHTASVEELWEELEILGAQTNRDGISFHARMGLLSSALDELERLREENERLDAKFQQVFSRHHSWFDAGCRAERERDALRLRLKEATLAMEIVKDALDHAIHRPHEHNPTESYTTTCGILLNGWAIARAVIEKEKEQP